MMDMTKLNPCELVAHLDSREHAEICGTCDYSKETERRLERLEKCEAKRCCELNERMWHEVHDLKAALEKCEAAFKEAEADAEFAAGIAGSLSERLGECEEMLRKSQRIEKEGIQAIASAAAAEKRLEKCKAALRAIPALCGLHKIMNHNFECTNPWCKAARAALEAAEAPKWINRM